MTTLALVAVSAFAIPFIAGCALALGLHGRVALGAAAGQELLVWPMLAVAVTLASDGRSPLAVAGWGVASLALVVAVARVVPARGALVLLGLAASAVSTELAGLHLVIGAFLFAAVLRPDRRTAGLALLRARPARVASAMLLPVFFALPAMRVDVGVVGGEGLALFALVLAVAAVAKLASATAAARIAGMDREAAQTVGVLMNARGLVELVVLVVGLEAGLIDEQLVAVMVLVALATTFATGPLADRIERRSRRAGYSSSRPATVSSSP